MAMNEEADRLIAGQGSSEDNLTPMFINDKFQTQAERKKYDKLNQDELLYLKHPQFRE